MSIKIKIGCLVIFFLSAWSLSHLELATKRPLYWTPPSILRHFNLGYQELVADLLWLRFLQSADFCSFEKGIPVYDGQSVSSCELGWSYRMLDVITELAPRFKTPYRVGGVLMSVFSGDVKGAEKILLKGLNYFSTDWQLHFYLAYLYAVEFEDPWKANYYSYQAAQNGGPDWLGSQLTRQFDLDRQILGKTVLSHFLKKNLTDSQKNRIIQRLQTLQDDSKKIE